MPSKALMSVTPHQTGSSDAAAAEGVHVRLTVPVVVKLTQIAVRWKWVILGILVLSLFLSAVVTLLMTPKYTSTARLEISRERQNITNVENEDTRQAGQDVEFYKTQYSLLEARSLAERVARSLRLAATNDFFVAHGITPEGDGSRLTPAQRKARESEAVDLLLAHIDIVPIPASSLVDVSYTSYSPEFSARIANEWSTQFIAAGIDRRYESTAYARRVLANGLSDLARRLEASERAAVDFASANDIVALSRVRSADGKTEVERTLVSSDLDALNTALAEATAERVAAESRASGAAGAGLSDEALSNPAITGLRQRRAEIASELAKLSVQFESTYPAVRALQQQLGALDASIAREVGRIQTARSTRYSELAGREEGLRKRVEELKKRLDRQQSASIQYNILQREADTNRQLYDSLLQRSKQISVSDVGATNVAVVDAARLPTSPSSPRLILNLAIALFAGIGLSAVVVFALEQIDEGLREPSDVNRLLNVPLIGSVPKQSDERPLIEALGDAKSEITESYLSVLSSLTFSSSHGVPTTLMVTSSRPAEGKSTTAAALAIVLGRTNKRVLLIDGDMRSPSVHDAWGISNGKGLSNFLAGDNDWQGLVQPASLPNIALMPTGPKPPSAAELLSSDRMVRLLSELQDNFDHVVVDAPPILGLADAPLLAKAVEGCIFVVEAEGVAVRGLRAALQRLQIVHAHVIGVVLTKLSRRQAAYGYGYGYGFEYGQSPKD
jgi:polysaccharide biosynthesis transport protein